MEDIINRVKDCIQKTTNIYKQEQFNKFIDNYNNVLTFQGDKKENLQKMFNILLQYDDKEKINFEDNLADKGAWHTFIWFGTLVMLSDFLSKFGLMTWIGGKLQFLFMSSSPINSLIILSLIYFYIHYLFLQDLYCFLL